MLLFPQTALLKGVWNIKMFFRLIDDIKNGKAISREEAIYLTGIDTDKLADGADIIRKHFCGNSFDMCTIINGKSGRCSENCKYCAQSSHFATCSDEYPLLPTEKILEEALYNDEKGVLRYSVVTSGKRLSGAELDAVCESYRAIRKSCGIKLCASHGLLDYNDFVKLREAGVTRYHNNLETSRRKFPDICTTHSFDDKIRTIKAAQKAGIEVCSGGIIGMGETALDRIDMAFELKALGINSVPVNILNPIKGTPLGDQSVLPYDEIRKTVSIFRFILPKASIRLAGGRGHIPDKGRELFKSGANAAISGDMLTTSGICIDDDMKMLRELGYEVKKHE